ncbi:MAG: hypothetical protein Q4E87_03965, partial [bacterium]|nr:hypothetical protein [bacterium]
KVSLICADDDFPSLVTDIPKLFPNISSMTKKDAGYEKNCIKISFETLLCCKNTVEFVFEKFAGDLRVKDISVKELSD